MRTLILAAVAALSFGSSAAEYQPEPWNLSARRKFAEQRFGIFIHWGLYANYAQGEWYQHESGLDTKTYGRMMDGFCPSKFDAKEWVRVFKEAGARYVTITSRHHDGFSLWPTKVDDGYNIAKTPFRRDILGELAEACRAGGLQLNFYYSLMDWHRADYPAGDCAERVLGKQKGDYASYKNFMLGQIGELIDSYRPGNIWFDGEWEHARHKDGKWVRTLDWDFDTIYDFIHSKHVLVANNNHQPIRPKEDLQLFERDLPGDNSGAGYSKNQPVAQDRPIEQCDVIQKNVWGYKINERSFRTAPDVVKMIVRAAAKDSNLLMNIGPDGSGRLPAKAVEVLKEVGVWMAANGQAIYGTRGGGFSKDGNVAYTKKDGVTYAITLPADGYGFPEVSVAKGGLAPTLDVLEDLAKRTVVAAARHMDGGLTVYNPDVGGSYQATWLRDYAYMLEADAVPHETVNGASRLFLDAVSTNGWGVDCIKYDGTPVYMPGYGTMGRLAVADGSPFTVAVAYLSWKVTRDASWLADGTLAKLEKTMAAAPVRPGSPLAFISPDEAWERAAYGFTDSVRKKGHCFFESLLLFEAETRLAEMYRAAGKGESADVHAERAKAIADAVNATFWDEASGLYRAATVSCREHDVWGSAFAVWLGVADGPLADAVSRALAKHFDGLVRKGQVRHNLPGEYWEVATCGHDIYQNGGFWGTPVGWFAWALERTAPERVDALYLALAEDYRANGVCEWSFGDRRDCNKGYPASVCLPLAGLRRILATRR